MSFQSFFRGGVLAFLLLSRLCGSAPPPCAASFSATPCSLVDGFSYSVDASLPPHAEMIGLVIDISGGGGAANSNLAYVGANGGNGARFNVSVGLSPPFSFAASVGGGGRNGGVGGMGSGSGGAASLLFVNSTLLVVAGGGGGSSPFTGMAGAAAGQPLQFASNGASYALVLTRGGKGGGPSLGGLGGTGGVAGGDGASGAFLAGGDGGFLWSPSCIANVSGGSSNSSLSAPGGRGATGAACFSGGGGGGGYFGGGGGAGGSLQHGAGGGGSSWVSPSNASYLGALTLQNGGNNTGVSTSNGTAGSIIVSAIVPWCVPGYFSVTATTCALATSGTYSLGGALSLAVPCPSGTYGSTAGLTTALCSGPCSASPGFACQGGSVSPAGTPCLSGFFCAGGSNVPIPCECAGNCPASSASEPSYLWSLATFAGNGTRASSVGPNLANVTFNQPFSITFNGSSVFVGEDTGGSDVRFLAANSAGVAVGKYGSPASVIGPVALSRVARPLGLAADSFGGVYVSDMQFSVIRYLTPNGTYFDNAPFVFVPALQGPNGLTLSSATQPVLYVADSLGGRIFGVNVVTRAQTLVCGNGTQGWADGSCSKGEFKTPYGVALNPTNAVLYVADFGNHAIRASTYRPVPPPVPRLRTSPPQTHELPLRPIYRPR